MQTPNEMLTVLTTALTNFKDPMQALQVMATNIRNLASDAAYDQNFATQVIRDSLIAWLAGTMAYAADAAIEGETSLSPEHIRLGLDQADDIKRVALVLMQLAQSHTPPPTETEVH